MAGGEETSMSEEAARALMRRGLSDDAIARKTGLSLMAILDLRATAAVEERRTGAGERGRDAGG